MDLRKEDERIEKRGGDKGRGRVWDRKGGGYKGRGRDRKGGVEIWEEVRDEMDMRAGMESY